MPGNHTVSRSRAFVFTMPWWRAWAMFTARFCNISGRTILSPRRTNPSSIDNSSLTLLYAAYLASNSCHLPETMQFIMSCSPSSLAVSFSSSSRGILFFLAKICYLVFLQMGMSRKIICRIHLSWTIYHFHLVGLETQTYLMKYRCQ